jgi:threonine synthase
MRFVSTRGEAEPLAFSQAVAAGLASDGGLYLPESLPRIDDRLAAWENLPYPDLCAAFLGLFATDIPAAELHALTRAAMARFDHPLAAPLVRLDADTFLLELFHGPTLAFKDFALQLLGLLYARQIERSGEPITVLGATSGDTGAAAIHGLLGRPGVRIFILYPEGGVAPLQEMQMTCTGDRHVHAIAVRGSFDDAQAVIKAVFSDLAFKRRHRLSAVNSINLARVLAQCVYYIAAWRQLPPERREQVRFIVPTGNFGNVLAGWLTHQMGLPLAGLRIATNRNDILYRLFTTGKYRLGAVEASLAPSMDIQIASNFERFLYYHEGCRPERVCAILDSFRRSGAYSFPAFAHGVFSATRADDDRIRALTAEVYAKYRYVVDPHTACAFADLPADGARVILGTAHPAKFPDTIRAALGFAPTHPSLEALIKGMIEMTDD